MKAEDVGVKTKFQNDPRSLSENGGWGWGVLLTLCALPACIARSKCFKKAKKLYFSMQQIYIFSLLVTAFHKENAQI